MPQKDQIITWLKDAHAMEQSLTHVLERHARDVRDFPDMRERFEHHLEETRHHADRIRSCLDSLGAAPSTAKSMAGGFMGMMEGMSTGMFSDQLVKNAIGDYAMEHFEMACYSALAAAAEDSGFPDIAQTCREIFGEEAEMADWLEEQVPQIARMHIHQTPAGK